MVLSSSRLLLRLAASCCLLMGATSAFCPSERPPSIRKSPFSTSTSSVASTKINAEIEELMSQYDPILLYVSRLLPPSVALEASALYAWCRRLDEITDNPQATQQEIREQLKDWQNRFDLLYAKGEPVDAMDAALAACLERNPEIGSEPFVDMMAACKQMQWITDEFKRWMNWKNMATRSLGLWGSCYFPC